jgi:hypothetical protein
MQWWCYISRDGGQTQQIRVCESKREEGCPKTHPGWDWGPHPNGRPQNGEMRVVGLGNFLSNCQIFMISSTR